MNNQINNQISIEEQALSAIGGIELPTNTLELSPMTTTGVTCLGPVCL